MKFNRKMVLIPFERYKAMLEGSSNENVDSSEKDVSAQSLSSSEILRSSERKHDLSSEMKLSDEDDTFLPLPPDEFFQKCSEQKQQTDTDRHKFQQCQVKKKRKRKILNKPTLPKPVKRETWITLD
jgi:hypothetical protein